MMMVMVAGDRKRVQKDRALCKEGHPDKWGDICHARSRPPSVLFVFKANLFRFKIERGKKGFFQMKRLVLCNGLGNKTCKAFVAIWLQ